jgi:hypothetical protein
VSFVPRHKIRDGWEHTREAKDKISAAMKVAAARRKAATANRRFFKVTTRTPYTKWVHAIREDRRAPMCGAQRSHQLVPTESPVNCIRCLERLPNGVSV